MINTSIQIEASGISDIGPVREENQDTIHFAENIGLKGGALFAVADGMGGYSNGKLASSMAIDTLFETMVKGNGSPVKRLLRGVESANARIYKTTQQPGMGRMGTTLTAVYLEGSKLTVAHIGDSRAYLIEKDNVICLTRDHTVVGDLVRMRIITPDKVRNHDQRSILTRGLGLTPFVHPDISRVDIHEGDKVIICSDGFWSMVEDDELPVLGNMTTSVSMFVDRLVKTALERGSDDNVSIVGFQIQKFSTTSLNSNLTGWNQLWIKE